MNKLTEDRYFRKYPIEEAHLADYGTPKKSQITFNFPEVLKEEGGGDYINFYNDGVSTYFEIAGAYQNCGLFTFNNKIYTDMELYEFVYNFFSRQIEDSAVV